MHAQVVQAVHPIFAKSPRFRSLITHKTLNQPPSLKQSCRNGSPPVGRQTQQGQSMKEFLRGAGSAGPLAALRMRRAHASGFACLVTVLCLLASAYSQSNPGTY